MLKDKVGGVLGGGLGGSVLGEGGGGSQGEGKWGCLKQAACCRGIASQQAVLLPWPGEDACFFFCGSIIILTS